MSAVPTHQAKVGHDATQSGIGSVSGMVTVLPHYRPSARRR